MDATQRPVKFHKIVRFVVVSAWDLLSPGIVDKTHRISSNFYKTFLAADAEEKQELGKVAESLTVEERRAVITEIAEELQQNGVANLQDWEGDEVREAILTLINSLKSVGEQLPETEEQATEILRGTLNDQFSKEQAIPKIQLSSQQKSVAVHWESARVSAFQRSQKVDHESDFPEIPGYRIVRHIGTGGFAQVYLATHLESNELRALKVGPLREPERFEREIRLVSQLDHPHLVKYHEWGQLKGRFWIAMDYLSGCTLADFIRQAAFRSDLLRILPLINQILLGLEALHDRGVIHRDVKPSNIMVDDQFRLKLIDFGLAKSADRMGGELSMSTETGQVLGTIHYMSLEQLKAQKNLTPACDLYSFGAVVYEMLTGTPPHVRETWVDTVVAKSTEPVEFSREHFSSGMETFLAACLAQTAEGRPENASLALQAFSPVFKEEREKLVLERDRATWEKVLDLKLLQQFASMHKGEMPKEPVQRFMQMLASHNVTELDEERIQEVLPPVFDAQREVEVGEQNLFEQRQEFAKSLDSQSGEDIIVWGGLIKEWEKIIRQAQKFVRLQAHREVYKYLNPIDGNPRSEKNEWIDSLSAEEFSIHQATLRVVTEARQLHQSQQNQFSQRRQKRDRVPRSFLFKVPAVAEGVEEVEISDLYVKKGDIVEAGQEVIEIGADKTSKSLSTPISGAVVQLFISVGDVLPVGGELMKIVPLPSSK